MSRITRFAARDAGPAARMAGFIAHLRANGLRLGAAETSLALEALNTVNASDPDTACSALKSVCASSAEEAARFPQLFDSFWRNGGRVQSRIMPKPDPSQPPGPSNAHSSRQAEGEDTGSAGGESGMPDGGEGAAERDGEGLLTAVSARNLMKKDLRELVQKEDIAAAEKVAACLGAALRDRRDRRRKAADRGRRLHFRKVIRRSLATGGEPLRLFRKTRLDRPVKIAALCDVSGSMTVYSRVFLAFLAGLMRADPASDAYLFHTRLVRITGALRDKDALRALGRLSVMAEGFGGGSRISAALDHFSRTYARRFVDGRTAVLILSDGYDTDPPEHMARALARLRKRGCRIIWLNPMKGWEGYEPIARGMAAALPHLDLFCAANRLEDLAALETELARI
ncbi:VWA domain-containing protein [Leisingera sp. D0M16]|uniref:vWA domain-containing protein n=1 Tax=Leisingera coralii TaxID=3351347 RepID=UPI003B8002AA